MKDPPIDPINQKVRSRILHIERDTAKLDEARRHVVAERPQTDADRGWGAAG